MEIKTTEHDGVIEIAVSGRLDVQNSVIFDTETKDAIKKGFCNFVINLSDLDYISSAGLRSLLSLSKQITPKQGKLGFFGGKKCIMDIFTVSGFSNIFAFFDSLEAALKHYHNK